jgi:hypothetical protein
MRIAASAVVLFSAVIGPLPAMAADEYPYEGYFVEAAEGGRASPLDIRACALAFFKQELDGRFTAYHADLGKFEASGELRYVVYQRGHCSYEAATKLERCETDFDTDPEQIGMKYSDVVDSLDSQYLHTTAFDTVEQGEAFVAGTSKEGADALSYYRCPFDRANMAKLLGKAESTASAEEREALTRPKPSMLIKPVVRDLMDRLGLVAP